MEVDVAGEDPATCTRDSVRDAGVVGGGEQRGLDRAAGQPGGRHQRGGLDGGPKPSWRCNDQTLKLPLSSVVQRALSLEQAWLSWEASAVTLRPAAAPQALAYRSVAREGIGDRVVDAQAAQQAVGVVGAAGGLGAEQLERMGVQHIGLGLQGQGSPPTVIWAPAGRRASGAKDAAA